VFCAYTFSFTLVNVNVYVNVYVYVYGYVYVYVNVYVYGYVYVYVNVYVYGYENRHVSKISDVILSDLAGRIKVVGPGPPPPRFALPPSSFGKLRTTADKLAGQA